MKIQHSTLSLITLSFVISFSLSGCTSMPKFDKVTYEKAVSLKVDSLHLMNKSTEKYSTHKESIEQLTLRLEKAYEYEKGKPNNKIITRQWFIIQDPKHHQMGGYLKRWKEKETLSKVFTNESRKIISTGFDEAIGLMSGLIKRKEGK